MLGLGKFPSVQRKDREKKTKDKWLSNPKRLTLKSRVRNMYPLRTVCAWQECIVFWISFKNARLEKAIWERIRSTGKLFCHHLQKNCFKFNNFQKRKQAFFQVIKRPRAVRPTLDASYVTIPPLFWNFINFEASSVSQCTSLRNVHHFETYNIS